MTLMTDNPTRSGGHADGESLLIPSPRRGAPGSRSKPKVDYRWLSELTKEQPQPWNQRSSHNSLLTCTSQKNNKKQGKKSSIRLLPIQAVADDTWLCYPVTVDGTDAWVTKGQNWDLSLQRRKPAEKTSFLVLTLGGEGLCQSRNK